MQCSDRYGSARAFKCLKFYRGRLVRSGIDRGYQFLPALAFLPARLYASAVLDRALSVVCTCDSIPVTQLTVLLKRVDEWSDATESLLLMCSQVA